MSATFHLVNETTGQSYPLAVEHTRYGPDEDTYRMGETTLILSRPGYWDRPFALLVEGLEPPPGHYYMAAVPKGHHTYFPRYPLLHK